MVGMGLWSALCYLGERFLAARKAGDKLEVFLDVNLERLADLPKPYQQYILIPKSSPHTNSWQSLIEILRWQSCCEIFFSDEAHLIG